MKFIVFLMYFKNTMQFYFKGKFGMKYAGRELEAMREITKAHVAKSIRAF